MYAECKNIGGTPSCSCLPRYIGSPPICRPECRVNSDCPMNLACTKEKCRDPCQGSCSVTSLCTVYNHVPVCTCPEQYTGDPFSNCYPAPSPSKKFKKKLRTCKRFAKNHTFIRFTAEPTVVDPCASSPCGPNTQCNDGVCTCLVEYQGDPYVGCRPECVLNTDCPQNRACVRNKCVNPCPGICGRNAECLVYNHIPMCTCPSGMIGNAFVQCIVFQGIIFHIKNVNRN